MIVCYWLCVIGVLFFFFLDRLFNNFVGFVKYFGFFYKIFFMFKVVGVLVLNFYFAFFGR